MTKFSKLKHQVKSNMYYIFWGACTAAVMAGQIYVGNGYRKMSETGNAISADINLLIEVLTFAPEPKGRYEPLVPPPTGSFSEVIDPDDYIIWLETNDPE